MAALGYTDTQFLPSRKTTWGSWIGVDYTRRDRRIGFQQNAAEAKISGKPECYYYEYRREGTANLFMFFAPLSNRRHVKVTSRRTKTDWAMGMSDLVNVHFPNAERIIVLEDQHNTYHPGYLYEVFEPAIAKHILDRKEFRNYSGRYRKVPNLSW